MLAHCASSVTSTERAEALPPSAVIMSTVRLARPSSRSTTRTLVPLRASRMHAARPLPMPSPAAPPPVTIAARPASPRSSSGRVVAALMGMPFVSRSGEARAGHVHADGLDAAVALVGHRRPAAGAGADVEGAAVGAAQHAGEGVAPEAGRDAPLDRAALADPQEIGAAGVADPDRALGVEADAVGEHAVERGPDAAPRQRAVGGHVEGGEPLPHGLGHDQGPAVGG